MSGTEQVRLLKLDSKMNNCGILQECCKTLVILLSSWRRHCLIELPCCIQIMVVTRSIDISIVLLAWLAKNVTSSILIVNQFLDSDHSIPLAL
jgi:hypothetical protein